MAVTWPRGDVLAACKTYAPIVTAVVGIDSAQLLAAISANESSVGADCGPRLEPAWDTGGKYAEDPDQASLLSQFGQAAARSYGPFQIMFYNAPGYTPDELNTDLKMVTMASIYFLNKQIRVFQPKTIYAIGQIWNGGHPGANSPGVVLYCKELQDNYDAAAGWLEGI
jgi:hypothetical protein